MSILKYPTSRNVKSRSLNVLPGSREEAAIYDLIFNRKPLRKVAAKIGLSYQGVYIRALAYMLFWHGYGVLKLDPKYVAELKENNQEEGAEDIGDT